jgi:hypothetical protein
LGYGWRNWALEDPICPPFPLLGLEGLPLMLIIWIMDLPFLFPDGTTHINGESVLRCSFDSFLVVITKNILVMSHWNELWEAIEEFFFYSKANENEDAIKVEPFRIFEGLELSFLLVV